MIVRVSASFLFVVVVVVVIAGSSSQRQSSRRGSYSYSSSSSSASSRPSPRPSPRVACRCDIPPETSPGGASQPTTRRETCTHCTSRDRIKDWQIGLIKRDILRKLRLKAPPNITNRDIPDIPQVRLRQREFNQGMLADQASNDDENFHATNLKVMRFGEAPPAHHGITARNVCAFTFQPDISGSNILQATLFVYVHRSSRVTGQRFVNISRYRPARRPGSQPVRRLVNSKRYQSGRGQWYHFNVRRLVREWLAAPNTTHAIEVDATDDNGRSLAVVQPDDDNEAKHRPFVEIAFEQQEETRYRRQLGLTCNDYATEHRCCRYPLDVDFEEFQWDWIIAPKRYKANYCSGECPYVFFQEFPHTQIISQLKPDGAGPCCNPSKVSAIPLIYFTEDFSIISGTLPGMIVERCGCA